MQLNSGIILCAYVIFITIVDNQNMYPNINKADNTYFTISSE